MLVVIIFANKTIVVDKTSISIFVAGVVGRVDVDDVDFAGVGVG